METKKIFLEFTVGGLIKLTALDAIYAIEVQENGDVLVNGTPVDQKYEAILVGLDPVIDKISFQG